MGSIQNVSIISSLLSINNTHKINVAFHTQMQLSSLAAYIIFLQIILSCFSLTKVVVLNVFIVSIAKWPLLSQKQIYTRSKC